MIGLLFDWLVVMQTADILESYQCTCQPFDLKNYQLSLDIELKKSTDDYPPTVVTLDSKTRFHMKSLIAVI
jgi:hypothetical protein